MFGMLSDMRTPCTCDSDAIVLLRTLLDIVYFVTEDIVYLVTEDIVYYAIEDIVYYVTEDIVYCICEDVVYFVAEDIVYIVTEDIVYSTPRGYLKYKLLHSYSNIHSFWGKFYSVIVVDGKYKLQIVTSACQLGR